MKCSECGAQLSSEVKFCTSCGTPVPSPDLSAKCKCGAELEEGLKFCTQCGEKVESAAKKAAPPSPSPAPQPAVAERQPAASRPQRDEVSPGSIAPHAGAGPSGKPSSGLSGGKIVALAIVALVVFVGMWFFSGQSKNQPPASSAAVKSSPVQSEAPRTPPASTSAAAKPMPSFDCSKAASVTEKLICSDAELAKLDSELAQIYAKAKEMAPDKAAFQQQSRDAWQRREEFCKDKECLEGWYYQRMFDLNKQIEGSR